MNAVFYLSATVAITATAMVITRTNAMHALLYLIVSFLAVSVMFYTLGAPFIAALEVIVYTGAIMVLFVFAIMLLKLGPQSALLEHQWLRISEWIGPAILSLILLVEFMFVLISGGQYATMGSVVEPRQVGASVFSTYLIGVELASILLLASLVGANHLGQKKRVDARLLQQKGIAAKENPAKESLAEEMPGVRPAGGEFQVDKDVNGFQGARHNTGEVNNREI
jgi:NADH-quinone oxidoreductase subunit J